MKERMISFPAFSQFGFHHVPMAIRRYGVRFLKLATVLSYSRDSLAFTVRTGKDISVQWELIPYAFIFTTQDDVKTQTSVCSLLRTGKINPL